MNRPRSPKLAITGFNPLVTIQSILFSPRDGFFADAGWYSTEPTVSACGYVPPILRTRRVVKYLFSRMRKACGWIGLHAISCASSARTGGNSACGDIERVIFSCMLEDSSERYIFQAIHWISIMLES